jgi:hypothetical protein
LADCFRDVDGTIARIDRRGTGNTHDVCSRQLGRGTAPQEGVGLSHAIAESLIQRKVCARSLANADWQAFVLFATHFRDLAQTLSTQPGIIK